MGGLRRTGKLAEGSTDSTHFWFCHLLQAMSGPSYGFSYDELLMLEAYVAQDDLRESSSQCSGSLTRSGRRSTDPSPRSETLPIKPDRISKVMTVDIQTGSRQVSERDGGPELAPPTPPRTQGAAVPLRRTERRKLAARKAAATLAEGAALGLPSSTERPYFKVRMRASISVSYCSFYIFMPLMTLMSILETQAEDTLLTPLCPCSRI